MVWKLFFHTMENHLNIIPLMRLHFISIRVEMNPVSRGLKISFSRTHPHQGQATLRS